MFFVESREELPCCSVCGGDLKYRDCRKRILKKEGGEKCWLMIRRYRCTGCRRYHNELPDCLAPFKHYSAEIISGVLDDIVSPADIDTEDYPSSQTMHRWRSWFRMNQANMEGHLRNASLSLPDPGAQLLYAKDSLLDTIRHTHADWLEIILRIIYNSGGRLPAFSW